MARRPQTITRRVEPVQPIKDAPSRPETLRGDVRTQHPELVAKLPDYQEMRDARAGQTTVKGRGEEYLPMPSGFRGQSDGGATMYNAYVKRAQFPELLAPTTGGMVGIINRREFRIEGLEEGKPLAGMWESATPDGLPLEALIRRITDEVMSVGRVVLLGDVPETPADGDGDLPYVALYQAEDLINWSEERDFFVLREEYRVRDGFHWDSRTRYRVLTLGDPTDAEDDGRDYHVTVVTEETPAATDDKKTDTKGEAAETHTSVNDSVMPEKRGGGALEDIPLVVVGSRDLSLEPDEIPLLGVGRACMAMYRLDADYRHQLYMSGQETLFVTGMEAKDAPKTVGAGVVVTLPLEAEAKYVGPSGEGIEAHRTAIEDERKAAAAAGAQLLDTSHKTAESGDALRIRARAATASLVSVALAVAAGLEQVLRHCAMFVGQDPEEIVVVPNLDFVDTRLTPEEIKAQTELWMNGAISYETFYENLQRGEIASQDRTAEEEQELVAEEESQVVDDETGALEGVGSEPDLSVGQGTDETEEVSDEELAAMFDPELLDEAA